MYGLKNTEELSDAWTGFTRFVLLSEGPPDGFSWSATRLTRKQTTSRPDNMYGQICGSVCPMQREAKRSKSGLSRNQSSIMPDKCVVSSSLNQKIKNSNTPRKTLVESWKFRCRQQCLVKTPTNCSGETSRKTKYACIVDADESMRIQLVGVPHRYHEDHTSAKGVNSLSQHNLVHKFNSMPQAFKNSRCKGSSGKRMGKCIKYQHGS